MSAGGRWRDLLARLGFIDRRVVHLATLAVAIAAVLWPPALPVRPRPDTIAAFRLGQGLRPGDAVFIWIDYGFGAQEELDPLLRALLLQLMRQGALLCIASRSPEGAGIADAAVRQVGAAFPAYAQGYGRTWLDLGYRPAADVALRAATADLPAAYNGVDETGRALSSLPAAAGLRALGPADFRLAYVLDWGDGYAPMMTYVSQVTGLRLVVGAIAMEAPVIEPYVQTGQIAAVIAGTRGAAEYESLLDAPGIATALHRGSVLAALFVCALLLAGNLGALAGG